MATLADILTLVFFAFVVGSASVLAAAYWYLPLASTPMRRHVLALAVSYVGFVSAPALHGLRYWPHDHTATNIVQHFGPLGTAWLVVCAVLGVFGVYGGLRRVASLLSVRQQ